jgi:hypothetical protein
VFPKFPKRSPLSDDGGTARRCGALKGSNADATNHVVLLAPERFLRSAATATLSEDDHLVSGNNGKIEWEHYPCQIPHAGMQHCFVDLDKIKRLIRHLCFIVIGRRMCSRHRSFYGIDRWVMSFS